MATERMTAAPAVGLALLFASCTTHLFSGVPYPSQATPVAMIETRGGVEFAATTEEGILFLGRSANEGPCRVHYFLGPTCLVEDGAIAPVGAGLFRAEIDLKHQRAPLLSRNLKADDSLVALLHRGSTAESVSVRFAEDPRFEGDLIDHPGVDLPVGTPVFVQSDDRLLFAGLVSALATLDDSRKTYVLAGHEVIREAMALPRKRVRAPTVKHRPDDITVIR